MRTLLLTFLALALGTSAAPAHAEGDLNELEAIISGAAPSAAPESNMWQCNIEKQFACKKGECSDTVSKDRIELDFTSNTYRRCNEKQSCKGFPMVVSKSGDFIVIALPENGVTFKVSGRDDSFTEAATIAGIVINSFGSCNKGSTPAFSPAPEAPRKGLKSAEKQPKKLKSTTIQIPSLPIQPKSLTRAYSPSFAAEASTPLPPAGNGAW